MAGSANSPVSLRDLAPSPPNRAGVLVVRWRKQAFKIVG